mgnify:CR=1 FL=1
MEKYNVIFSMEVLNKRNAWNKMVDGIQGAPHEIDCYEHIVTLNFKPTMELIKLFENEFTNKTIDYIDRKSVV